MIFRVLSSNQSKLSSVAGWQWAHKVEPFGALSWELAAITIVTATGLSFLFGTLGACISFALSWGIAVAWATAIYRRGPFALVILNWKYSST